MVQAQAQFIYLYEACLEGLRKLEEKCAREIAWRGKDDNAKQAQLLADIEAEFGNQQSALTTCVLPGSKKSRQLKPDFPKESDGLGLKYTHDISAAHTDASMEAGTDDGRDGNKKYDACNVAVSGPLAVLSTVQRPVFEQRFAAPRLSDPTLARLKRTSV
jgi:hypothetical protein